MTATNNRQGQDGAGPPSSGDRFVLSRRNFGVMALATAGGLAFPFARENPQIEQLAPNHLWEYAYVYAYE